MESNCNKCNVCNFETCNCETVRPFEVICPTPNKCNDAEMFNALCFEYTTADIKCGTKSIIFANNPLSQILSNIVEFLCKCNLAVTINLSSTDDLLLESVVTGGTAPYTYQWSANQNSQYAGHLLPPVVADASLLLGLNVSVEEGIDNFFQGTSGNKIYKTLIKLKVTDAKGCTADAYYTIANSETYTLDCSSITNNGTLTNGVAASGVSSVISYSGGNGGPYGEQTVLSTGVNNLIATLQAGTFANGNGSLTFTITGTPYETGTATFIIYLAGQTCTINRTVV
jgi:hypothetical protein